ncbi:hypothetical protein [Capnocytophaga sputigena]|jgi:hypothetical protein|uniref:hypothetical protein n=1 Tax=Capnocytophaga sputigena TaxID=1019 RepID=UPI0028E64988|nr:hypothetical protein [Capnocytophaga sputigena]
MINKNLLPSIKSLLRFNRMRKISVQGISFMKNRKVKISKLGNKFILCFNIRSEEHNDVESAKETNFPKFSFLHNKTTYIITEEMSRISKFKDNISKGDYSLEVEINSIYNNKINTDKEYYFRYFIPTERKVCFNDYDSYNFQNQGKYTNGELIKINILQDEIHLYNFEYSKKNYLIIESSKKCSLKYIEDIAYASLLTLGFLSGKLYLNEAYIIASNKNSFNNPIGVYYKSLRESISGQYSVFTTNAYSVLIPIAKKMSVKDAENRMLKIINNGWKSSIDCIEEVVFSNIVKTFYENESIARAALTTLTASKLGLEIQPAVYCISFEAICSSIIKIKSLNPPNIIEKVKWEDIKKKLLNITTMSNILDKEEKKYLKNKINNLNQPPNTDKLSLPFKAVGYNLSKEEIEVIKDRNKFLHGHLNINVNETEINKLFYTSLMLHRLCCVLILKLCGFQGYIINNKALFAKNINRPTYEWGFKKI